MVKKSEGKIRAYQAQERAAKKRHVQSRHCGNKVGYATRAQAHGAMSKLRARVQGQVTLEAYHCRFCGQYHLGKPVLAKGGKAT